MQKTLRLAHTIWAVTLVFVTSVSAFAQTPPASPGTNDALKVFIACTRCDPSQLRSSLGFVEIVNDTALADVDVSVAPAPVERGIVLTFTGRGAFTGQNRVVRFRPAATTPPEQIRAEIERRIRIGLAEYAAGTVRGRSMDITFRRPGATPATSNVQKDQRDPWHHWVFRLGADSYGDAERSASSSSYYLSSSANRTTEHWKIRVSTSRSLNKSSFTIDDGETFTSRLSDWSVDSLIVKSLNGHWSFGMSTGVNGSSFSNSRRVARFLPGIEYDIFPYAESSRRSLTLQYNAGPAHYEYENLTIFDKLSETIAQHSAIASLGLRQPWGTAGGSVTFTQHLTALERTRLSLSGSLNVRLIKSLTMNASGSYSRIRDQFTLEKGDATDDEVLLRQRQLATGFRYSFSVGFGYSFGALSNTTVNPRFGG